MMNIALIEKILNNRDKNFHIRDNILDTVFLLIGYDIYQNYLKSEDFSRALLFGIGLDNISITDMHDFVSDIGVISADLSLGNSFDLYSSVKLNTVMIDFIIDVAMFSNSWDEYYYKLNTIAMHLDTEHRELKDIKLSEFWISMGINLNYTLNFTSSDNTIEKVSYQIMDAIGKKDFELYLPEDITIFDIPDNLAVFNYDYYINLYYSHNVSLVENTEVILEFENRFDVLNFLKNDINARDGKYKIKAIYLKDFSFNMLISLCEDIIYKGLFLGYNVGLFYRCTQEVGLEWFRENMIKLEKLGYTLRGICYQ